MGKIKKKFSEGASKTYTTRNRALKKLQVTLVDFRRLCILKGVYPVEPRSRKKANKGSTEPTTFYYSKDIQLLMSEPLINKFRDHKVFLRRLKNALGKRDLTRAKSLEKNRPDYTLDHLVIERYPTFVEALRDLDDALCMVFLFATMPVADTVDSKAVEECRRLSTEFMHYVIHTHSLRKVFLSIKGIYYQAELQGQTLTWVVPYQFSQNVPREVDFQVMSTFLQFYRTLLGFVNYRLYTTSNLAYPPKDNAAGLGSLRIESKRVEDLIKNAQSATDDSAMVEDDEATEATEAEKPVEITAEMKARLNTLGSKIKSIVAATPATAAPLYDALKNMLFGKQVFFLSREVPRYSLDAITIQIADRPTQGHQFLDRKYVQPQWVYDCINARCLLNVDDYLVGQPLPAHLSPFVEYAEGDYVPEAATKMAAAAGFEGEVTNLQPEDRDSSSEDEDEGQENVEGESADEDEAESDDEDDEDAKVEKQYQKQLLAERAGLTSPSTSRSRVPSPSPTSDRLPPTSGPRLRLRRRSANALPFLCSARRSASATRISTPLWRARLRSPRQTKR
ncbi:Pescadillo N-terminus-domain-containing protein, partial [Kickxella alabastrina]|uniref:Pescadillo N-terminus-domain-containing protein n=1 Tax=Kickxella alabastrina TaxID=61397 RepID=UPI00222048C1